MIALRLAALCVLSACAVPAAGCEAAVPADLGPGSATWLGACPGGHAEGPGVLRAQRTGGVRFFYGRMRAGRPETGVTTTAAGDYIPAWRFDKALKPVADNSGDRKSSVETFDAAAAGARAASTRFKASGNRASAALYARKAKDLAEQLD